MLDTLNAVANVQRVSGQLADIGLAATRQRGLQHLEDRMAHVENAFQILRESGLPSYLYIRVLDFTATKFEAFANTNDGVEFDDLRTRQWNLGIAGFCRKVLMTLC